MYVWGKRRRRKGGLFTMKGDAQPIRLAKDNPDFIVQVISHAFHDGDVLLISGIQGLLCFWRGLVLY